MQVEYPKEHFRRVVSLIVAINQFTFAFGPALLGWARDWWGSYSVALGLCIVCEAMAALIVVFKGERESASGGASGPALSGSSRPARAPSPRWRAGP